MSLLRRVIGAVLRRVRLRQRLTLREVAQRAGVSLAYLSEIERGRKEASSEVLAAICAALGLHLVDLLEEAREELIRLEPAVAPLLPRRPGGVPVPPGALTPQRPHKGAHRRPGPLVGQRPGPQVGQGPVPLARVRPGPVASCRSGPLVRRRGGPVRRLARCAVSGGEPAVHASSGWCDETLTIEGVRVKLDHHDGGRIGE